MAAPCALFTSCSDKFNPDEFIKLILDKQDLPSSTNVTETVKAYDWHIDTKYYTADVNLCVSTKRTIGNQEFAQSVQAFIVYFDPKEVSTFELTKAWLPYLEQIDPEILILVCDNCSHNDVVSRVAAQKWCIDNCFELVELNPLEENDDDDLEDDFVETTGIKRVIQALHAHTWPNLDMKENPVIGSDYYRQLLQEETELKANEAKAKILESSGNSQFNSSTNQTSDSTSQQIESKHTEVINGTAGVAAAVNGQSEDKKGKDQSQSKDEMIDSLLPDDDMALLAALGNEDPGEESFEQMFEKLRVMKEKAETLPPDQRKVYAEKIAVSFWKAIGGDEDEIEGLGSDDEIMPT